LLKCGRWLPLNWYGLPVGYERPPEGCSWSSVERRGADHCAKDEAFAHFAVEFPIDPRTVGGVWLYKEDTMLWLYSDDAPAANRTYFKRYARLMEAMDTWRTEGAASLAKYSPALAPTSLYDRRSDETNLDDVERISI